MHGDRSGGATSRAGQRFILFFYIMVVEVCISRVLFCALRRLAEGTGKVGDEQRRGTGGRGRGLLFFVYSWERRVVPVV